MRHCDACDYLMKHPSGHIKKADYVCEFTGQSMSEADTCSTEVYPCSGMSYEEYEARQQKDCRQAG